MEPTYSVAFSHTAFAKKKYHFLRMPCVFGAAEQYLGFCVCDVYLRTVRRHAMCANEARQKVGVDWTGRIGHVVLSTKGRPRGPAAGAKQANLYTSSAQSKT